jgi:hypothetical protein
MVTPEANPQDVRRVIETQEEDAVIQDFLQEAADEIIDEKSITFGTTSKRKRLEKYYAALKIAKFKERAAESSTVGDSSVTYDASLVSELEAEVRKLDPSNSLIPTDKPSGVFNVPDSKGVE